MEKANSIVADCERRVQETAALYDVGYNASTVRAIAVALGALERQTGKTGDPRPLIALFESISQQEIQDGPSPDITEGNIVCLYEDLSLTHLHRIRIAGDAGDRIFESFLEALHRLVDTCIDKNFGDGRGMTPANKDGRFLKEGGMRPKHLSLTEKPLSRQADDPVEYALASKRERQWYERWTEAPSPEEESLERVDERLRDTSTKN